MRLNRGKAILALLGAALCLQLCGCALTATSQSDFENEAVASHSEIQEYTAQQSASQDRIVGFWKILTSTIDGEEHSLWDVSTAYAQFKADGTWTLTLGGETYDFIWVASDENDNIPYLFTFADQAWGGTITDEIDTEGPLFEGDILLMGQISNADENNMTLVRVEE